MMLPSGSDDKLPEHMADNGARPDCGEQEICATGGRFPVSDVTTGAVAVTVGLWSRKALPPSGFRVRGSVYWIHVVLITTPPELRASAAVIGSGTVSTILKNSQLSGPSSVKSPLVPVVAIETKLPVSPGLLEQYRVTSAPEIYADRSVPLSST
jgi:hypothetical protein